ncbi:hypothetical protein [Actinopolymorpha pittospori]
MTTPPTTHDTGHSTNVEQGTAGPVLVDDQALAAGYSCGLCLDFGDLANLGPCPDCAPDEFTEYLALVASTVRVRA